MPDLLLELLTEEIPARMQAQAAEELKRLVGEKLAGAGLSFAAAHGFVTPRRLALSVEGLPLAQGDVSEERRGPRVGSPAPAVEGFLKSAGLATLAECEERTTERGQFYFAIIRRPGRATAEVLPELLRGAIVDLPWPKSMRFPAARFRWVRPLARVVALFDGAVLGLALDLVPVGDETMGHRFLSKGAIRVEDFADYRQKLRKAHVVLDPAERKRIIERGLKREAKRLGVTVRPDAALLDEVTGLVEWPVVLAGSIDREFMAVPPEVLVTSMRAHQKYFACLDAEGKLAPHFLLVANMQTRDKGAAIVAGNERVLRARLSDARFFWDQDRKVKLEDRVSKLSERVFFEGLGTIRDKVDRVRTLADEVTTYVLRDVRWLQRRWREQVTRPGQSFSATLREYVPKIVLLAKADLTTGMVGEFPELQGVMGRYYALSEGEPAAVAWGIQEHYLPQGQTDSLPESPYGVIASIGDKIDTLVGFLAIGEKPSGSRDPFALRRAALGVIRLILEFQLRLPLRPIIRRALQGYMHQTYPKIWSHFIHPTTNSDNTGDFTTTVEDGVLDFFADRLKVHLRERGVRHDLVAAVFAVGHEDDLVRLLARVDALAAFLAGDDGANLLTAYRRAANIVRIEERKDGARYEGTPDEGLYGQAEETRLAAALAESSRRAGDALRGENFAGAMAALATLRAPVDEFFTHVTVNCDDRAQRANRLRLLARIRDTLNAVADFSLIEG